MKYRLMSIPILLTLAYVYVFRIVLWLYRVNIGVSVIVIITFFGTISAIQMLAKKMDNKHKNK